MSRTGAYPRFDCAECGRSVASEYKQGEFTSIGDPKNFWAPRKRYAYLRAHRRPDGTPCPARTVVLATLLTPKRPQRIKGRRGA